MIAFKYTENHKEQIWYSMEYQFEYHSKEYESKEI